jgi:hypothetical protein
MTSLHGRRKSALTHISSAILLAIASDALGAADWVSPPISGATITIDMESLGPATRIAGLNGVWVRYAPTLSVDCSPPRGCYANTQRTYYSFSCVPRYAVLVERISMDLNGAIIKHEVSDGYTLAYDEAATRVLDTFCPLREPE